MPRVFCCPRWAPSDLAGDPEDQEEIDAMFHLRASSQPLDLINEANLMAYGLAPTGGEGEISKVLLTAMIVTVVLASQPITGAPSTSDPLPSPSPLTDGGNAPDHPEPAHPVEILVERASQVEAPTPVGTAPVTLGMQPYIYVLIVLVPCVSFCLFFFPFLLELPLRYPVEDPSVMALLRGAGSFRPQGAASGACKALRRSMGDSLGHTSAFTALTTRAAPFTPVARSQQKTSEVGPSSNSHSHIRASFEEEVMMIDLGKLPPNCKELASALMHFAPSGFHEEL